MDRIPFFTQVSDIVVVDKVLGISTTEIIGAHSKDIVSDVILKYIKPMSW